MTLNLAINDATVLLDRPGGLTLSRMSFITDDGIAGNGAMTAAPSGQAPAGGVGSDSFFGYAASGDAFRDSCAGLNGEAIGSSGGGRTMDVRSRPRLQDILLPGLFLAAIGLVLLCTDWTGRESGVAELENRNPAQLPALPRSLKELATYPQRFGVFFADHFGLRREMVDLRGRIELRFLHESLSPVVVVGSHKWLFYAGDRSIENYRHQVPLSAAELEEWARRIEERRAWFAAHGITYLFVVAPDKQSIYPEYMPGWLAPPPGDTRLDQLSKRLAGSAAWLDLRAPLRAAKGAERLYLRADTHWNDRGAYEGYRAIMQRLGLPLLPRDESQLVRFSQPDDLARMSGVAAAEAQTGFTNTCAVPEPPTFDAALLDLDQPVRNGQPAEKVPATRCPTGRERLLIFHDSFAETLSPYLSDSFARAVYVWRQPSLRQMHAMVAVEHPTVVIEERVERYLILPLWP